MPLFSNPFDNDVEKATSEMNTSEDWALMLDICDKAKQSQTASKNCLRSIMRQVFSKNPHVALQALSLLNACVKNAGRNFHLEVASRDFVTECRKIISDENASVAARKVSGQLKQYLKNWSETEFTPDSALSIIPGLYKSLKDEGVSFTSNEQPKSKKFSKDPNIVQSQEEEDDIAKAIALSLKESEKAKQSTFHPTSDPPSIYPSVMGQVAPGTNTIAKQKEPKKVRTLYDFEAVEDNELTFKAGEVIGVIDDSDQNWWKGTSWRGEGLFPANFVTFALEVQDDEKQEVVEEKEDDVEPKRELIQVNRIDEDKVDATLAMLQNADPTGDMNSDPENMMQHEEQCRKMLPLIDQELEKIDREHSKLMELNEKLIHSLELYHGLMAGLPSMAKVPAAANMALYQQHMEQQMMMLQLQQQQQQMVPPGQHPQRPPTHNTATQFQPTPADHNQQIPSNRPGMETQGMITQHGLPQQPAYAQPYYNSLSSYAEMYMGKNGQPINIGSIPTMSGSHVTTDDTNVATEGK